MSNILTHSFLEQSQLGLDSEPDFIKFSRYLTMGLSIYNIAMPFLFAAALFIGILGDFTNTMQQISTYFGAKWDNYKAQLDYIFDPAHMWIVDCTTTGDGTCILNGTWINYVIPNLIVIPLYVVWLSSFVVEHIVSMFASVYYIYMAGFMSFDWLYSLSRNVQYKKTTNLAYWYSVGVLGLNLLSLIFPTIYLGIYIISYLITGTSDATVANTWSQLGLPPTIALFFTVPFFISSFSWSSTFRVLQSY